MILLDYIQQLEGYKGKRDRIMYAVSQIVAGYPQEVLNNDLVRLEAHIKDLESLRVEPKPIIVRLVADNNITVPVGDKAKLNVEYTLADGTLEIDPIYVRATALFRDFDSMYNNNGFITSINLDGYRGEDATYTVAKTVNGFDVFDEGYTQGLHVVEVDGEFIVADINGETIGFTFTTDGKEQVGDNWTIRVTKVSDGTEFKSDNLNIAEVSYDGLVTGIKEGITFVTVRNGEIVHPITVNVVNVLPGGTLPDLVDATPPVDGEVVTPPVDNVDGTPDPTENVGNPTEDVTPEPTDDTTPEQAETPVTPLEVVTEPEGETTPTDEDAPKSEVTPEPTENVDTNETP